ncbi:putative alliin lyase [Helianthus anomalus]
MVKLIYTCNLFFHLYSCDIYVCWSGDLTFAEPFWIQNAANTAVVISGWHHMGYNYTDGTKMLIELENCIRKLHSIAGMQSQKDDT